MKSENVTETRKTRRKILSGGECRVCFRHEPWHVSNQENKFLFISSYSSSWAVLLRARLSLFDPSCHIEADIWKLAHTGHSLKLQFLILTSSGEAFLCAFLPGPRTHESFWWDAPRTVMQELKGNVCRGIQTAFPPDVSLSGQPTFPSMRTLPPDELHPVHLFLSLVCLLLIISNTILSHSFLSSSCVHI